MIKITKIRDSINPQQLKTYQQITGWYNTVFGAISSRDPFAEFI